MHKLKQAFLYFFLLSNLVVVGQIGVIQIKKPVNDSAFREIKIYSSKEKSDSTLTDQYFYNDSGLMVKYISYKNNGGKLDTIKILNSIYDSLKRVQKEFGWYWENEARKKSLTEWAYPDKNTRCCCSKMLIFSEI